MRSTSSAVESATPWQTVGPLRVRHVRYRAGAVQSRHRHREGTLSLVLAGQIEETSTAETHRAAAGSFAVKPAGAWHANHYGPRGALVAQLMSRDSESFWSGLPWQYGWREAPTFARAVLSLFSGASASATALEAALWTEFDAALPPESELRPTPPVWWDDAVDLLNVEAGVSVAAVARRVGVHPVHLARVCRKQFGCSVRAYLRTRRVLAAWRACEREEASLAAIAARSGFADQAHMTRAFAQVLGISPGRLRKLVRARVAES
ncbi:MAG: AraC family transcriptional regulator [Planctomycetota bacterium]|nr:MAG: AraC family transcriptional regulator [Planctomycetota bacterium]